jgi:hypothetical protein
MDENTRGNSPEIATLVSKNMGSARFKLCLLAQQVATSGPWVITELPVPPFPLECMEIIIASFVQGCKQ